MNVTRITATNVRQFADATFEFKPGFNVVVGENGAGKTTLLRSLLAVLGSPSQSGRRPALSDDDIRLHSDALQIRALVRNPGGSVREFSYEKRLYQRARRSGGTPEPLVFYYGSNEATTSSFVSRKIRRHTPESRGTVSSAEQFLAETERPFDFDVTPERRFGRSQAIRSFVMDVLSRISGKFRDFGWSFEPYDCSIRYTRASTEPLPPSFGETRRKLSGAIMRRLQETRRPRRWPDLSEITVDLKGFQIDPKGTGRPVIPELPEILSTLKLDRTANEILRACVVEVRLTPRIVIRSRNGDFFLSQLSDGEQRLFSLFVDIARLLSVHSNATAVPGYSGDRLDRRN
jgi:energy-coupling factor transporter ATP-binding protein EcfA2